MESIQHKQKTFGCNLLMLLILAQAGLLTLKIVGFVDCGWMKIISPVIFMAIIFTITAAWATIDCLVKGK